MTAASIRARVRAEMTDEIKSVARRHLATDGADLSLRAVARDLGMASSAVYRYFASRDELLTALIIDAYDALGEAAEAAEAGVERDDFLGRFLAAGHAVRDWALAHPHEWALIYGSPVPGYRAPGDTIAPAIRVALLLGRLADDATTAGRLEPGEPIAGALADELVIVAAQVTLAAPPQVVARTIQCWIQLVGAVSFELYGQLTNTVDQRREFLDFQLRGAAGYLGLR